MTKPLISIITPNFNKGDHVKDCIQSVVNQTLEEWEMLFVDDGSTDGSDDLARKVASDEKRIIVQKNKGIKGGASARNQGLKFAKGYYIFFLDSDDLITPNCLKRRVEDMQANPELDFIAYPMGLFDSQLGDSNVITNIPTEEEPLHRFLNRDILWQVSGPTWKRSALERLGGFDESLHSQQDVDLHVRALILGLPFKYFHVEPDVFYRREVESIPRSHSQSLAHFQFRFEMILRHIEMLEAEEKLGRREKTLLAAYLLDIAQMLRWHIKELGKEARYRALTYWRVAKEKRLVDDTRHMLGVKYIRFKHNMKWNRLPKTQRRLENYYCTRLGELIFKPSKTYCNVTLEDYEG
jgi:glycosyltransferase involved in cell wall biosynthesis